MKRKTRKTLITLDNKSLGTYKIKLFLNDIYQPYQDCFASSITEAIEMAEEIEETEQEVQQDFCKAAEKREKEMEIEIKKETEYPIHESESGELIGWLNVVENEELPKVLCIRDIAYMQVKIPNILCPQGIGE